MTRKQQVRSKNGENKTSAPLRRPEAWPTRPGATSPYLQIPSAPTMDEIQDAFCQGERVDMGSPREGLCYESAVAAAVAVEESNCTTNEQLRHHDHSVAEEKSTSAIAFPSPFIGYMDENGVIHKEKSHSRDFQTEPANGKESLEKKKAAFCSTRHANAKVCQEEKTEIPTSVEDILQASLNFERTHPEKRFSSSLDHYYSGSVRNLYPSIEDVGEPPFSEQESSTRQESTDSVQTTWKDVVASAASVAAAGYAYERSVVPEPPDTETYAVASAVCEAVEDDEDVKIGVARAELDRADTDSPAYAVASVDNTMAFASAEATVLGTSETADEALLEKLAAEDAELAALKRSSYWGGYGMAEFSGKTAAFPDQQATVVSISENDIHPSELSQGAVRAELIGEDYNNVSAIGSPFPVTASLAAAAASATSQVTSLPCPSEPVFAMDGPGYAFVDKDVSVIDGGAHWATSHAEEATVLNEEISVPFSDRKRPAVASMNYDPQLTPPRSNRFGKNTGFYGDVPSAAAASAVAPGDAEGSSVSDDPDYGMAAYSNTSSVAYAVSAEGHVSGLSTDYAVGGASNFAYADHAGENYEPAMGTAYADGYVSTIMYEEDQAEVTGIEEEYHPAELVGNEAQAEFVGAATISGDYVNAQSDAVAFTEELYHATEARADHAQILEITEEFHPLVASGNEAQAELVGQYDEITTRPFDIGVETMPDPEDEGNGIQAATVIGYEDEDYTLSPRARSYGPSLPDHPFPSARAYSAPAAVGTRIDLAGAPCTPTTAELGIVIEEDWMRTPSLALDSACHGVIVIRPLMDGVDDDSVVAVAALEAYTDAPAPRIDEFSCSPAGYAQPVVTVASIDAYASSPAPPTFDDTNCSWVNRGAFQPEINAADELGAANAPAMPPPRSFNSQCGTSDNGSVCSAASVSTATTRGGFHKISNSFQRGMELLWGTPSNGPSKNPSSDTNSVAKSVMSRQLLPWSVIYSEATNMWVATVNTNQKALDSKNVVEASKALRAFSVVTEKQATCLAKAWSPPRMHDFKKNNACHICKAKFAVFRRACHCRNCGVTICVSSNGCSRPWPAKMCPETYNIKKESFLNVCAACDFVCTSFRLALLEGDRDKAIALHATGNINIVTPFANVKGELFYPVHCAALGGNLDLLKWLVDENCCPIKSVRVSGRSRDSSNSFTEISTSKGRSLLGIALENRNVGIVRYLVVEKGIQLSGEKDITMDTLCRNLELVLRLIPEDAVTGNSTDSAMLFAPHESIYDEQARQFGTGDAHTNVRGLDNSSDGSVNDACIICFDRSIDCVATPCGHQVCCLDCSKNITRCPVCAVECSFMRVFRP